jgi:hypothetical protein
MALAETVQRERFVLTCSARCRKLLIRVMRPEFGAAFHQGSRGIKFSGGKHASKEKSQEEKEEISFSRSQVSVINIKGK